MISDQTALRPVVNGSIWDAQQRLRFGPMLLRTRMTVIKLSDGSLWVHSPIEPTVALRHSLASLGPVRHVVAPNLFHHRFFAAFVQEFPQATGWIAPGLQHKRPDLAAYPVLSSESNWGEEMDSCLLKGLPVLNETVWIHRPTSTLIATDILFCLGNENPLLTRLAGRVLGVQQRVAMSRTMRWMVRDREALARSVEQILAWHPERLVLAHDRIIEDKVPSTLVQAFEWLKGPRAA